MYKIDINEVEKQFIITLAGLLDDSENAAYLMELESKLHMKNFNDYVLIVDTSDLKITTPEKEANMQKGIELIVKKPFRVKYNIAPKSAVTNLQANRVGSSLDIKNQLIRVASLDEIFAVRK